VEIPKPSQEREEFLLTSQDLAKIALASPHDFPFKKMYPSLRYIRRMVDYGVCLVFSFKAFRKVSSLSFIFSDKKQILAFIITSSKFLGSFSIFFPMISKASAYFPLDYSILH